MSRSAACPVCEAPDASPFYRISGVPVHIGVQWETYEEAIGCLTGDLDLYFCEACGHLFNASFDPALVAYEGAYENALDHSPRFQSFTHELATHLIERYAVRDKIVVDVGCGKGDFLLLLSELGPNRGYGFDRSYEAQPLDPALAGRVRFITDFYSERYASIAPDLLCCRQVLEHLPDPVAFLSMIRRTLAEARDPVVYFEVPNGAFVVRDLCIWTFIYEHCSYFCPSSLAHAFMRSGYDVLDLYETFETQFLGVEARPGTSRSAAPGPAWSESVAAMRGYVASFRRRIAEMMNLWQGHAARIRRSGLRAVLWGAGARAVSFLNMLQAPDLAAYAVDINPHKHGKYLAGSGQQIVPPAFLATYRPDIVIVMNPIYRDEIERSVNALGLSPEFLYAN